MNYLEQNQVAEVAAELNHGQIAAVPTETVYGLAIKHNDEPAIKRLIKLKNRTADSGKVFALMLANQNQIGDFAIENDLSKQLSQNHFPGELTLVLPKNPKFKNPYFNNFDTIGIRIPKHDFMLSLLKMTGPLIVTSANLRGEVPALTSDQAAELPVDAVVVGQAGGGQPSTVAKVAGGGRLVILRQGDLVIQ